MAECVLRVKDVTGCGMPRQIELVLRAQLSSRSVLVSASSEAETWAT